MRTLRMCRQYSSMEESFATPKCSSQAFTLPLLPVGTCNDPMSISRSCTPSFTGRVNTNPHVLSTTLSSFDPNRLLSLSKSFELARMNRGVSLSGTFVLLMLKQSFPPILRFRVVKKQL
eukprot:TRINITY_DN15333_c0_g1_i1.p1 TRINITY_DN15333_c0_g1~~TRINITY_DN15333_c0_g1_i1.p1  ORF type:complete len:119 (-),score=6.59 TRINITY_DN15333_c0_g1_i1:110-466(-)